MLGPYVLVLLCRSLVPCHGDVERRLQAWSGQSKLSYGRRDRSASSLRAGTAAACLEAGVEARCLQT